MRIRSRFPTNIALGSHMDNCFWQLRSAASCRTDWLEQLQLLVPQEMSTDPFLYGYGRVNPPPPYGTTNQHYHGHSRLRPGVIHPQYLSRTMVVRQRPHCRFFKALTVAILVWILFGSLLRHLWHSRYKYGSRPHVRYIVLSTLLSSVNLGNSGVSSLVTQTWTIHCHLV